MDQDKIIKIYARSDNQIQLKMIPGHFVTSQSHITHYLDLTTMKSRCSEARRIASSLAANYEASIPVDTIVCMDGLEVVGASRRRTDQSRRALHERPSDHLRYHSGIQQHRTDDLPRQLRTNDQRQEHPDPQRIHHHRLHIKPRHRKRFILRRQDPRCSSHLQQRRQRSLSPCTLHLPVQRHPRLPLIPLRQLPNVQKPSEDRCHCQQLWIFYAVIPSYQNSKTTT